MITKIKNSLIKLENIIEIGAKFILDPIKIYIKSPYFRRHARYAKYYDSYKIKENIILYESHHGKSLTCSPYAIFLQLLNDKKYRRFIHIWSLEDFELNEPIIKEFENYKNVKFIRRNSREYLKYLAKAKYLINNVTFLDYFIKKDDQVYVNTWHGTPLKYLGKDVKDNELNYYTNATRNFLQSSYFLSPNNFTTEIFMNSYDLKNIYNGKFIEEGYPRIDLTLNTDKNKFKEKLKKIGIDINKKVILYAPTWRGGIGRAEDTSINILKRVEDIIEGCPSDYQVLLKVHSLEYKNIKGREDIKAMCIPDYIDSNELLSITDILITDYSSIYFDYLVTDKPVVFYMYDKEQYKKTRGMYIEFDELPGPICETKYDIYNSLQNIEKISYEYKENYMNAKNKFCTYEDGNVTERIIDAVFNENNNYNIINAIKENKEKVLIHAGNFKTNGVTTSILNLLDNIDYNKYDVSIILSHTRVGEYLNNMRRINPNVRKVYRIPFRDFKLSENYRERFINRYGLNSKISKKIYPQKHYEREFKRIFGNLEFDCIIEYCGYSVFFANLLSNGNSNNKVIYQHSDMLLDSNRITNNKYLHKHSLNIIFSMYHRYNTIVSVSESSWEENKKNFEDFAPKSKFIYINNPINYNKISQQIQKADIVELESMEYRIVSQSLNGRFSTVKLQPGKYLKIEENIVNGINRMEFIPLPKDEEIKFVTVGRLSQEKAQDRLIKAFTIVNKEYPNTKLYIIGDGDKKNELINLTKRLNMENKVLFTGQLENPFPIVKCCDCFVLSSNYEGQGLAILEALLLDMPVISTDIPGPRSILIDEYRNEKYGELVDNNEKGLENGMIEFISSRKKYNKFDYKKYNEEAMTNFYNNVLKNRRES